MRQEKRVLYMKTNVTFWSHLAQFFIEWKIFQTKLVEIFVTHFMFNNFFFPENRALYEIRWRNVVKLGRPEMTIWRLRIACWIPKATNTHAGCVILIAFPLQQWLHELATVLRYTYIACLVLCSEPWYVARCSGEVSVYCEVEAKFWNV